MNIFDALSEYKYIKIPIGYDVDGKSVVYKYYRGVEVDLDKDINNKFSLEFLNELPENYKVVIGDTFYMKNGAEFVYDYLQQSYDFTRNLDDLVHEKIYIIVA